MAALLIVIILACWNLLNRADEAGWSIGGFLHNSGIMVSDTEQSQTDVVDSSGGISWFGKQLQTVFL